MQEVALVWNFTVNSSTTKKNEGWNEESGYIGNTYPRVYAWWLYICSLFFAATQTKLQQIDYTYQTKLYVVEVFLRLLKRDLMRMCDLAEEKT